MTLAASAPWMIVALIVVGLAALIAGRNLGGGGGGGGRGANESEAVAEAPDAAASAAAPAGAGDAEPPVRAPDISAMSPRERADRLYDRVMRLSEEGKTDSVQFFAPMVASAYQMLGPLDLDEHYDLGRVADVTGVPGLARAEADTILRANPNHLLGLALAARTATAAHDSKGARAYYARLVAAVPRERDRNLPEYQRHKQDIDDALAEARRLGIS
jgi:hypothetical protein